MTKINLPKPECNRTGTGNIFNLIMRMTVPMDCLENMHVEVKSSVGIFAGQFATVHFIYVCQRLWGDNFFIS